MMNTLKYTFILNLDYNYTHGDNNVYSIQTYVLNIMCKCYIYAFFQVILQKYYGILETADETEAKRASCMQSVNFFINESINYPIV